MQERMKDTSRLPAIRAGRMTKVLVVLAAAVMFVFTPSTSATLARGASTPDKPLTAVMLTVSPNPSYPGQSVQFQWTATGFHGIVTCTDSQHWVNGSGSGSFSKTAGVDFTASFRWTVDCDDGDFFAESYVDVLYITTPPPPPPPGPPPPVQIIANDSNLATFRNQDGDWTIWKLCSSPQGGPTVGPGYVARLVTPQGMTVLDDWAGPPGGLNGMRGGLGAFGVHYARGFPPFDLEQSNQVADMTGRSCFSPGGQGVYRTDIAQGPLIGGDGNGVFDLNVWIRDEWGHTSYGPDGDGDGIGDAGLEVSYALRIYPSVVKHWATVTTFFASNGAGLPFAKEPKFTGSAPNTAAGYKRIAVFGDADGLTFLNAFMGSHAQGGWHSYKDNRLRVRYDFATDLTNSDPHCQGTVSPCLNVLFRAIPAGGPWKFWEQPAGSNAGLDKWATDAGAPNWPRADTVDHGNSNPGNGDKNPWNCHATPDSIWPYSHPEESTAYTGSPGDVSSPGGVRRWEFGGVDPGNGYTQLMMLANGWEGGRGARDCESTSMQFPSPGTSYSVEMDYSIDAGW